MRQGTRRTAAEPPQPPLDAPALAAAAAVLDALGPTALALQRLAPGAPAGAVPSEAARRGASAARPAGEQLEASCHALGVFLRSGVASVAAGPAGPAPRRQRRAPSSTSSSTSSSEGSSQDDSEPLWDAGMALAGTGGVGAPTLAFLCRCAAGPGVMCARPTGGLQRGLCLFAGTVRHPPRRHAAPTSVQRQLHPPLTHHGLCVASRAPLADPRHSAFQPLLVSSLAAELGAAGAAARPSGRFRTSWGVAIHKAAMVVHQQQRGPEAAAFEDLTKVARARAKMRRDALWDVIL